MESPESDSKSEYDMYSLLVVDIAYHHNYFNCANTQVIQYFVRLGEDVKIIYPQKVRDEVYNFHLRALDRYQKKLK